MDVVVIPVWVIAAVLPILIGIGGFLIYSALHMSPVQRHNAMQAEKLQEIRVDRIEALEKRVEELEEEVKFLLTENRTLIKERALLESPFKT